MNAEIDSIFVHGKTFGTLSEEKGDLTYVSRGSEFDVLLDSKFVPPGFSGFSATTFHDMIKIAIPYAFIAKKHVNIIDMFSGWGHRHYILSRLQYPHINYDTNPNLLYPHKVSDSLRVVPDVNDFLIASPPYDDREKYHTDTNGILYRLASYLGSYWNSSLVVINDAPSYQDFINALLIRGFSKILCPGRKFVYLLRIKSSLLTLAREYFYTRTSKIEYPFVCNRSAMKIDQIVPYGARIFEIGAGPAGVEFLRGRMYRCLDYHYRGENALKSMYMGIDDLGDLGNGDFFDDGNLIELRSICHRLVGVTYVIVDLASSYLESSKTMEYLYRALFILKPGQSLIFKMNDMDGLHSTYYKFFFKRFFRYKPYGVNNRSAETYVVARHLLYDIPLQHFFFILNKVESKELLFGDVLEDSKQADDIPISTIHSGLHFNKEEASFARDGITIGPWEYKSHPLFQNLKGEIRMIYRIDATGNYPHIFPVGATYRPTTEVKDGFALSGKGNLNKIARSLVEYAWTDITIKHRCAIASSYIRTIRGVNDLFSVDFSLRSTQLFLVELNERLSRDNLGEILGHNGWVDLRKDDYLNGKFFEVEYLNASLIRWMYEMSVWIKSAFTDGVKVHLTIKVRPEEYVSKYFDLESYKTAELRYEVGYGLKLCAFGGIRSNSNNKSGEIICSIFILEPFRGKHLGQVILLQLREQIGMSYSLYVDNNNIPMMRLASRVASNMGSKGDIIKFQVH